jgi:hypothetical protein
MRKTFVILIVLFSTLAYGTSKKNVLTPFQKNIRDCLQDDVDAQKLTSLSKIYKYVSEKYLLLSSEIVAREVLYKMKNETRKLKFENGKVHLFKVLEDEDDQLMPINNEVRQRSLTTESYLAQLLLNADIRSDWTQMSEKRSGSTGVVLTSIDGEMKTLIVERTQLKKKLECLLTERAPSCSCSDLN